MEENLDIVDENGNPTGEKDQKKKPREKFLF